MNVAATLILSLVLLAEATISRFLTGSALHLSLVLLLATIYSGLRLFGRSAARPAAFACAGALGVGGWLLFGRGFVPVSLSELPGVFHVAIGIHFLLWTLALDVRRGRKKGAPVLQRMDPLLLVAGILAGAAVAWTTGTVEIYLGSELMVRSLGFGVLAGCVLLVTQSKRPPTPRAVPIASPRDSRRWQSTLAISGACIGTILLAAALITPSHQAAGQLYTWFGIDDDVTSLEDFGSRRPQLRSGSGDPGQTGRELPRKADIELDGALRFFLEVDDDASLQRLTRGQVYTRTSTLSIFADDGRLAPLRTGQWRYDADDGSEDGTVNLLTVATKPADAVTYSVLLERRDSQALPLVARTHSVALGSIFAFADDWYQLALEEHQERVRFRATSAQRTVLDLMGSGEKLEIGTAPGDYRMLPPTPLAGRVRATAESLRAETGARNLEILLPEIRNWLAGRCSYSLRYDNPDDLTPVENFLFGEKRGHCELFAASTVMLLRSIGIPSRVAFGFCGGEADFTKRIVAFRESDFHAWAEIYLDEHGWVIFETTPAGYGAVHRPRNQTGGPAFADVNLAGYEFLGDFGPIEPVEVSRFSILIRNVTDFASDWFFGICGGLIAITSLAIWLRRRRTGRRPGTKTASLWPGGSGGKPVPTPDFLKEYVRATRNLGFEKRPGQTWGEFLQALKQAGICNGEFDELTRYVYGIRYAGLERDRSREQEFRQSVQSFAEAQR